MNARLFSSIGLLWLCVALSFPSVSCAQPTDWSVTMLDQILASVPPGQNFATVGDMQILTSNLRAWRNQLAGMPSPRVAFDGTAPLWTGGNLYYTFDASVSAAKQKVFLDGAAEWATFANLHFFPRTAQANYFTVKENPSLGGGQSAVGMIGGQQFLEIGPNAWNRATICHELGHTLGMVHEQQRSDRTNYVVILTNNIVPGQEGNFVILNNSQNQGAYDFLSVMHYSRNSFSINPATLDTMQPQPAYAQFINIMGAQFDPVLSAGDRAGAAAKYGAGPVLSGVVTNTQDSGPGSLRAAIYYAFDHPGSNITFNIPASDPGLSNSVFAIQITDDLPSLVNGTLLDGSSEPTNSNPDGPDILINGALCVAPVYANGLKLAGTNCTVQSLIVNGFNSFGVVIDGPAAVGNIVRGCYLGVSPGGTAPATNSINPIVISGGASRNLVGGTNATARNIISGSLYQGLVIRDSGTRSNSIQGNYIGISATSSAALSNTWAGVEIYGGAQDNIIGGTNIGAKNVISGNGHQGVVISGATTSGNLIQGNWIGLNSTGNIAIPNGWSGVEIFGGARSNLIGGNVTLAQNIISGNTLQGIAISGSGTIGNVVAGNIIGLNGPVAMPTGPIPNGWAGIQIFDGAQSNLIGGTTAGARNVISGNAHQGIAISDANTSGNVVSGNYIGLHPGGTTNIPNSWSGVEFFGGASANLIGGTATGASNVISGNANYGVVISGTGTVSNVVAGNWIGLNAAGAARGNTWSGVAIYGGARGNVVGGAVAGAGNVISGNTNSGVLIADAGTSLNALQGNIIGLNAAGTAAIGNGWDGVSILGSASSNIVGGASASMRNVISGNTGDGVYLVDPGTVANLVQGNYIGVGADGVTRRDNLAEGVLIFGGSSRNVVGFDANGAGAGNIIAFSGTAGIVVTDAGTTNNTIRGNNVYSNAFLGIDLGFNSVSANDANDLDSGPNSLQNFPVISSALISSNVTILSGTFNSRPNRVFVLDFYRNTSADPLGFGEGQFYLGGVLVTTDGSGNAIFGFGAPGNFAGQYFTANATDRVTGDSSEFSQARQAVAGVGAPLLSGPLTFSGAGFTYRLAGLQTNRFYRVEASTNLTSWVMITNFLAGATNLVFTDSAGTNFPRRFYRGISP